MGAGLMVQGTFNIDLYWHLISYFFFSCRSFLVVLLFYFPTSKLRWPFGVDGVVIVAFTLKSVWFFQGHRAHTLRDMLFLSHFGSCLLSVVFIVDHLFTSFACHLLRSTFISIRRNGKHSRHLHCCCCYCFFNSLFFHFFILFSRFALSFDMAAYACSFNKLYGN